MPYTCPVCAGQGSYQDGFDHRQAKCYLCDGKGETTLHLRSATCNNCDGRGALTVNGLFVRCTNCNGSGRKSGGLAD